MTNAMTERAGQWQDISTAPRDGTHFLAYEPTGDMYRAAYGRNGELHAYGGQPVVEPPNPTHWIPLPELPEAQSMRRWRAR